jgi:hypothetical protein
MSNLPGFNEPFHSYYDQYSIPESELTIPSHFAKFIPDNQDDYNCTLVICPDIEKGAKRWTKNGRIITIGIYRDEGRVSQRAPIVSNVPWVRTGNRLIFNCSAKHRLAVGDIIDVANVNVTQIRAAEVVEVGSPFSFAVKTFPSGVSSGTDAGYQPQKVINFYETYRVFRLLPSFKLITISELNQIFSDTAPVKNLSRRSLHNITTNSDAVLPSAITRSVNYELPKPTVTKDSLLGLRRRFGQEYDEDGRPLKLEYQETGIPVPLNNVDSKYRNDQVFRNTPAINTDTSRIYVYDFYGIDLNDPERGPHYRTDNVYAENGLLKVKTNNADEPIYSAKLHDEFGNHAIGVQSNNSLIVRKQILPLKLNAFNIPVKFPIN